MWVGDRAVRGVGLKSAQVGSGRLKNGEVGRWHRGERNIWKNSRDAGSLGGKKNRLRAPNLITRRKIILLAAINHVLSCMDKYYCSICFFKKGQILFLGYFFLLDQIAFTWWARAQKET